MSTPWVYDGDIRITATPAPEHPHRARLTRNWEHGSATATFDNPDRARLWANHPGTLPDLVAAYRRWAGMPTGEQGVLL